MINIKQIVKYLLSTLWLMIGMNLYGQNDLYFSCECHNRIISPITAKITLKCPNKESFVLFADTVRNFAFSGKNYFKTNGNYTLSISFKSESHGKDSIDYVFNVTGAELRTDISILFDYKDKNLGKGDKIINGYIRHEKYYTASKLIDIKYLKDELGNDVYNGPFFTIKNNSKDTLYGDHLPGYFWGTLLYLRNDSILKTNIGIIDHDFVDSPPLYPDSTRYATVGSFGIPEKLIPFEYRFEVMVSDKWRSEGVRIYKEHEACVWWVGKKNNYKLKCDFKIDK